MRTLCVFALLMAACVEVRHTYSPCETDNDCPGVGGMCTEDGFCAYIITEADDAERPEVGEGEAEAEAESESESESEAPCEITEEVCDSEDNDCDGVTDEDTYCAACPLGPTMLYYRDEDGDGVGNADISERMCSGLGATGWIDIAGDCDDTNPEVQEDCSGGESESESEAESESEGEEVACVRDSDCPVDRCRGSVCLDNACYQGVDDDGDGYSPAYGPGGMPADYGDPACEGAWDCDDTDPDTHSGAEEICDDDLDNNCDGFVDDSDEACDTMPACTTIITPEGEEVGVSGAPRFVLHAASPSGAGVPSFAEVLRFTVQAEPGCAAVEIRELHFAAEFLDRADIGWTPSQFQLRDPLTGATIGGPVEGSHHATRDDGLITYHYRVIEPLLIARGTSHVVSVWVDATGASSMLDDVLRVSLEAPAEYRVVETAEQYRMYGFGVVGGTIVY